VARRSIEVEHFGHGANPIPAASRVRPARHVIRYDHFGEDVAIQLEGYAVIQSGNGR